MAPRVEDATGDWPWRLDPRSFGVKRTSTATPSLVQIILLYEQPPAESVPDIRAEVLRRGLVAEISDATICDQEITQADLRGLRQSSATV